MLIEYKWLLFFMILSNMSIVQSIAYIDWAAKKCRPKLSPKYTIMPNRQKLKKNKCYICRWNKTLTVVLFLSLVMMWHTHIEGRPHTHPPCCAMDG